MATKERTMEEKKERIVRTPEYPLLTLNGIVVFPHVVLHFEMTDPRSIHAVEHALESERLVFLTGRDTDGELFRTGVVARVKQVVRSSESTMRVMLNGVYRAKLVRTRDNDDYTSAVVKRFPEKKETPEDTEITGLMRTLKALFADYASKSPSMSGDFVKAVLTNENPYEVFENIAVGIPMDLKKRQQLLEANGLSEKLMMLITTLNEEIAVLGYESDIRERVHSQIASNQREYFLREQMKAISRELGEYDEAAEGDEYVDKIKALSLSEEYEEKLLKEADRLAQYGPGSPESGVIKTYLDTVLDLPWHTSTKEINDIKHTAKILDDDHYGLKKVKERILETIAVKQLAPETKGQIICLYGPPGVGKTSIAKSIARSLGRNYTRVSLGGVRDESDIRGHRKTYIGAMPGRIIAALLETKANNPLILLDEIDKMSHDFRGDPSSALLEVLDSEQNTNFRDHYIDLPFDLSNVMFITTANDISVIDPPLRDRMEIIELSSYTREEKFHIAKEHLIPKQLEKHGMKASQLRINNTAVYELIDYYTREAGVRELERVIASLCRKAAKIIVEGTAAKVSISGKDVKTYLGNRKYIEDFSAKQDSVGVVNGLAWTSAGGTIMPLEVLVNEGHGNVTATGSLGEVMQESSRLAVSFVRSIADEYGIEKTFYMSKDIHIHAPEGATPKDGPSAGVTMTTALVSALTGIPVHSSVAMTGEITLHGKVLPIGGLREKTMAAYKEGIKTVIIPKGNRPDLDEIEDSVKENIRFVFADEMKDVLDTALAGKPQEKPPVRVGFTS